MAIGMVRRCSLSYRTLLCSVPFTQSSHLPLQADDVTHFVMTPFLVAWAVPYAGGPLATGLLTGKTRQVSSERVTSFLMGLPLMAQKESLLEGPPSPIGSSSGLSQASGLSPMTPFFP